MRPYPLSGTDDNPLRHRTRQMFIMFTDDPADLESREMYAAAATSNLADTYERAKRWENPSLCMALPVKH